MTDDQLKIAVVGTSIGCKLHIRALRGAGFDVTHLVGRDPERTSDRAKHFGIPVAATSFDAVIDSDVDAIVVATPPSTHHPFTMKAIEAGKHVLCEKPFALDIGQAREMRDAASEAGVIGQVVHPHRWFAHRAAIREAVRSGAVGDPIHATFVFDHFLLATGLHDTPGWWTDATAGGGWLRNFASHGIDALRYMVGDIAAVCGSVRSEPLRDMTADDAYAFAFRLENGAQGAMAGTCRSWDFCNEGRITGSRATAGYHQENPWIRDADGERELTPSAAVLEELRAGGDEPGAPADALPKVDGTYAQIHNSDHGYPEQVYLSRSFRNRILDPTYTHPSVATFDDGIAHLQVILAVEQSSAKGVWVDVASVS